MMTDDDEDFSDALSEDYDKIFADADAAAAKQANLQGATLGCSGGVPSRQGARAVGTGEMEPDTAQEASGADRDEISASDCEENDISDVTNPSVCHAMNNNDINTPACIYHIPRITQILTVQLIFIWSTM
jgi:hypothetical protein